MNNSDLAIILQHSHENKLDEIESDVELMKMATELAHEEFDITEDVAITIGREVLKLYDEVVEN